MISGLRARRDSRGDGTVRDVPGPIVSVRGRNTSQEAAERPLAFCPTTFGRPRRSSANPARRTSRSTRLAPELVTRTVVAPIRELDVRRRGGERHRRPCPARAGRSGREQKQGSETGAAQGGSDHRPTTV